MTSNIPGFLILHDRDGRPIPINVASIASVVHRSVTSDDSEALICLNSGGKEAVSETVSQVITMLKQVAVLISIEQKKADQGAASHPHWSLT